MTLRFLIRKELKQFVRNQFLPKLIIVFPVMIMLVIPWIVNMDIRNIRLSIVDQDGSSTSEKLIQRLEASSYFILTDVAHSYREALRELELGGTDAVVEIPKYFEQSLISGEQAPLQISINAVNQTKGALGSNYLSAVCSDFYADNFQTSSGTSGGAPAVPRITISVLNKFNPLMDYKIYMIPAYMVIVIILLGGFLPALNIVGEKEKGTIEQINITPVRKTTFIFAKLIPYWVLGILVLSVCMLLFGPVHLRHLRIRPYSIELLRYHAAGHVRDVLLHTDIHAHERTAHTHILHAPLGSGPDMAEPAPLLHRDAPRRLPSGLYPGRPRHTAPRPARVRCLLRHVGRAQLSEDRVRFCCAV